MTGNSALSDFSEDFLLNMAFPICDMCASTGILCSGCERKKEQGKITELDVLVSHILFRAGVKGYDRLIESEDSLAIFAPNDQAPRIIGYGGKTVKELSRKLDKKVVVIESDSDVKGVIESIIRPNKVLVINKVYKADGSEILKLVLDKKMEDKKIIELVRDVVGREIQITEEG